MEEKESGYVEKTVNSFGKFNWFSQRMGSETNIGFGL